MENTSAHSSFPPVSRHSCTPPFSPYLSTLPPLIRSGTGQLVGWDLESKRGAIRTQAHPASAGVLALHVLTDEAQTLLT